MLEFCMEIAVGLLRGTLGESKRLLDSQIGANLHLKDEILYG